MTATLLKSQLQPELSATHKAVFWAVEELANAGSPAPDFDAIAGILHFLVSAGLTDEAIRERFTMAIDGMLPTYRAAAKDHKARVN